MAILLLGYDVEALDPQVTLPFVDRAEEIHTRLQAPTTFYMVGKTLEMNADRLRGLQGNPYFEFQSHTYSHKLLKTVCQDDGKKVTVFRGVSLEEADVEIGRANEVLQRELGVTCTGLTGPYNYYRGLGDRPDLLEVLRKHGIKHVRTYGRNEQDWQPVSLHLQPFWYEPQGFPEILECNINGWQDCIRREELGYENRKEYLDLLKIDLDYVSKHNLVFSYCQHDWSSTRGDADMWITEGIIRYAQDLGIQIMSYSEYYEMAQRERGSSAA